MTQTNIEATLASALYVAEAILQWDRTHGDIPSQITTEARKLVRSLKRVP